MKIETTIYTNTSVILTKKDVIDIIKQYIKDTQAIEVEHVNFFVNEDLISVECNVGKTEKK